MSAPPTPSAATTKAAEKTTAKGNPELERLIEEVVREHYDKFTQDKDKKSFDDFYHALHEIIQKLSEKKEAMQLKLPPATDLKAAFTKYGGSGNLSKKEFTEIVHKVVTMENFAVGQRTLRTIAFIFGAPICAFFGKSFIPRAASVPDDIVIPAVTSATVCILAKTNML